MDLDFRKPDSVRKTALEILLLIALILAGFAAAQGLGTVASITIDGIGISIPQEFSLPLSTLLSGAAFVIVSLGYLYFNSDFDILSIRKPTKEDIGWTIVAFIGLFTVVIVFGALVEFLGIESATNQVQTIGRETPVTFLYLIPLAFISVGVSEELLFRGVVQRKLVPHLGTGGALLVASILFAVAHVFALQGKLSGALVSMTVLFALGVIMGLSYEKTDNLVVPIIVHGAYDAVLFGLSYLVATGTLTGLV